LSFPAAITGNGIITTLRDKTAQPSVFNRLGDFQLIDNTFFKMQGRAVRSNTREPDTSGAH